MNYFIVEPFLHGDDQYSVTLLMNSFHSINKLSMAFCEDSSYHFRERYRMREKARERVN